MILIFNYLITIKFYLKEIKTKKKFNYRQPNLLLILAVDQKHYIKSLIINK